MDAARQLAQLVERPGELGLRLDEQAEDVVGAALERALGEPQLQCERDEPLLGAVVQVALQPAALGVAGLDDARAGGGELVVRVGVRERLRDEVGEVAEALLGALRQRSLVEGRGDERAPQALRELDRRGHARAIAVRAQVGGDVARVADGLVGIRHAARLARAVHLDERGVLGAELDRRPDREEQPPGLAPAAHDADPAGVVVAHERRRGHAQGARGLAHDLAEDARGVGLGDDERRDAAEGRLLLREPARRGLARGALGGHGGEHHRGQRGHGQEQLRREQAVGQRAADERPRAVGGVPDRQSRP